MHRPTDSIDLKQLVDAQRLLNVNQLHEPHPTHEGAPRTARHSHLRRNQAHTPKCPHEMPARIHPLRRKACVTVTEHISNTTRTQTHRKW